MHKITETSTILLQNQHRHYWERLNNITARDNTGFLLKQPRLLHNQSKVTTKSTQGSRRKTGKIEKRIYTEITYGIPY